MRKRIFEIIEVAKDNDRASAVYDFIMLAAIVISIIPLAMKQTHLFFVYTDIITTTLFIIDYILRVITADYKLQKENMLTSFLIYPFTPWAIVDLISILPGLSILSSGFKLLRLFRVFRTFRVFRVFKAFRYSVRVGRY